MTASVPLRVEAHHLHFRGPGPSEEDLCAHGAAIVEFGGECLVGLDDGDDWTLSAAALSLLRTLGSDHHMSASLDDALIPHCGHTMWKLKRQRGVFLQNCNIGVDWTVEHEGNGVRLTTSTGTVSLLPYDEWRRAVIGFSDSVEQFYTRSAPRRLPDDDFEREGFLLFQKEWRRRRGLADRAHRWPLEARGRWWMRLRRLIGR